MASAEASSGSKALLRDALLTIATRLILAVLIFGTDIALARLLGPAAKGRFTIVLLYSQLVALVLGWGMDQALAVASGRDLGSARRGFANAVIWTGVVGGFGMLVSAWAYGLGEPGPPSGLLPTLLPNLSERQFIFAAVAIPGELFFSVALLAILGRRMIAAYSVLRMLRRATLLMLILATAAVAHLNLNIALLLNLVALAVTALAIVVAAKAGGFLAFRPSASLLREQLGFGTRAVPGTLAERLQFRADAFIVNALMGVRPTGIYSVTTGLAETLWYIPNALGIVMFSRAVDPREDAARVAAILTRGTVAITVLLSVPALVLGPYFVRAVYGSQFADAGVALRFIVPGVIAYSIVAVLTRYLSGQGRPGATTVILVAGLGVNIAANLVLVPQLGINGAALASSLSYSMTALLTLAVFLRVSGRGVVETLVLRRSDLVAAAAVASAARRWLVERKPPPGTALPSDAVGELIVTQPEPRAED